MIPGITLSGKGSEKGSVCDGEVTGVAMGLSPPEDLCENSDSYSSPNSCQSWAAGCWGWNCSARVPQLAGESRQAESQCMHLEVLGAELFGRQGLPWPLCPS